MPNHDETLFAVATEKRVGSQWRPELVYIHAVNHDHASRLFRFTRSAQLAAGTLRIVAIGRAIGYFVNDKQGLDLSA